MAGVCKEGDLVLKKIGRRLYYKKDNGLILFDTGEKKGSHVKQNSYKKDIEIAGLERLDSEGKVDYIELSYGQHRKQIEEARYMKINHHSKNLKFYMERPYQITVYNGQEDYSYEDVIYMYDEYVEFNLVQMMKVFNFSMGWFKIEDLELRGTLLKRSWKNYYGDGFLADSANDRTLLAKDIVENGTYWPLLVETGEGKGYIIQEGNHRIISSKLLQLEGGWPEDKEYLSKIVYGDYPALKKPQQQLVLDYPIKQRIPFVTKFPGAKRDNPYIAEYMKENDIRFVDDKRIMIEIEADTYEEFLGYNQMVPHYLRNVIYEFRNEKDIDIPTHKVINNKEEWGKWVRRHGINV
jgi:hypothetical protein